MTPGEEWLDVNLGNRTVMHYLFLPVEKVSREAGGRREALCTLSSRTVTPSLTHTHATDSGSKKNEMAARHADWRMQYY
jgi:hypothetical protein